MCLPSWNLTLIDKAILGNIARVLNYPFNNFIMVSAFIITTILDVFIGFREFKKFR